METRKAKQKEVGFAIHGLRAYIKALELSKGLRNSRNDYRYLIAEDRASASIVLSKQPYTEQIDGISLPLSIEGTQRPLSEWSRVGKEARLGLIGLKAEKASRRGKGEHVQFTLNVITNEAYLSQGIDRLPGLPQTIAEWANLGQDIEGRMFESLEAARAHGDTETADLIREEMIELGIIREPRNTNPELSGRS
jgi:hypothetical protein